MVGRHLVQPGPPVRDAHVEHGRARGPRRHRSGSHVVDVRREARRLAGYGHPEQQAGPFAVEVERDVASRSSSARPAGGPAIGSVTTICRRSGVTGRSTPAVRRGLRPGAGAADHRRGSAPSRVVTTAVISPPDSRPEHLDAGAHRGAEAPGAAGVAEDDRLRRAVPVVRRPGRGEHVVRPHQRRDGRGLRGVDQPRRTPREFCSATDFSIARRRLQGGSARRGSRSGAGRSPAPAAGGSRRTGPGSACRAGC